MSSRQHHLALLPLNEALRLEDAQEAIDRLRAAGSLEVVAVALVEQTADGTVQVRPLSRPPGHREVDVDGWMRFFGDVAAPSTPGGSRRLSTTFLVQLGELVRTRPAAIALLVTSVDAGAVVTEFRSVPGAHFVHGAVPGDLVDRLLIGAAGVTP